MTDKRERQATSSGPGPENPQPSLQTPPASPPWEQLLADVDAYGDRLGAPYQETIPFLDTNQVAQQRRLLPTDPEPDMSLPDPTGTYRAL